MLEQETNIGRKLKDAAKNGVHDVLNGAGVVTRWAATKTWETYRGAARIAYELGRMKLHTSWKPVIYQDGVPKEVGDIGVISVAVPFKFDSRWYPAARNDKILHIYDPEFPQLVLSFEDPHPGFVGDEVLRLEVRGEPLEEAFGQGTGGIVWRLYMPGKEDLEIQGGGPTIKKPQAELTAGDVVEMLVNRVYAKSGRSVNIPYRHLHTALRMITERSPVLAKRWEILDERLEFQVNLMTYPYVIAAILRSMVSSPREEFVKFLDELQNGNVIGWGSFLEAVDEMQDLTVGGGGMIMPLLLYSGLQTVPSADIARELQTVPASLLVSMPGLKYFNGIVAGYREEIEPVIEKIAKGTVEVQRKSLSYLQEYLKLKQRGWTAATGRLHSQRGELVRAIEAHVDNKLKELKDELTQQMDGTPVLLQPSNGSALVQSGPTNDLKASDLISSSGKKGKHNLRTRGL
ncbi:MAG: hypothetical protein US50_C0055G0004 [Candidatus Nomurabacteria bacterium GW2011_GWB1_37_5]|uniref:Uncharacterized protein n=1 Tax=Candidatus Nomurabacteria bacterium GW2011_GWB1_37_5 TaxID=1618742 RepID=A0A0G0H6V1_9BACT|nr:MAG: hypothetical protein US50_C0055G0004 [Candidatus Nomurabacteria bacterium GW2011_GWB1_37_5]